MHFPTVPIILVIECLWIYHFFDWYKEYADSERRQYLRSLMSDPYNA